MSRVPAGDKAGAEAERGRGAKQTEQSGRLQSGMWGPAAFCQLRSGGKEGRFADACLAFPPPPPPRVSDTLTLSGLWYRASSAGQASLTPAARRRATEAVVSTLALPSLSFGDVYALWASLPYLHSLQDQPPPPATPSGRRTGPPGIRARVLHPGGVTFGAGARVLAGVQCRAPTYFTPSGA